MTITSFEDAVIECETRRSGLFPHEVKERLARFGRNEITQDRFVWKELLKNRFRSSFLYLLLAAALASLLLGDLLESALILVFIAINVSLECYQEYHSERTLTYLKRFLVSHVRVRRNGETILVENHEIVPGDIVLMEAGDRLAADVRIIEATSLMIDESVLTGESAPVRKETKITSPPATEMYKARNIGFAGTVVTSGRGIGVVFATGRDTAIGDIADLTKETVRQSTFEKGLVQFSRFTLRMMLLTLIALFIANVFIRGHEASMAEILIFSLALAVSIVPEALPVILTVSLSRGSLRLAKSKVVVKRLSAIEDLGSIEILCTDKTGTLTENMLAVTRVIAKEKRRCLILGNMAALDNPIHRHQLYDPFDQGLWNALSEAERTQVTGTERLDHLPFDPERRRNSVLVRDGKHYQIIVRGAFEEVLEDCVGLSKTEKDKYLRIGDAEGKHGRRVLAIAVRTLPERKKLERSMETDLHLVGLIAFEDPLKKTAHVTVAEAKSLGIQVKILTGDSRDVAGAVAHAVGLIDHPESVITGRELMALGHEERQASVEKFYVFARISPEEKYEIIKLLQEKHEVGFLGEGINDAAALKLANVALVVQGASDIAREAADVILLQKNLSIIIAGVKEGRVIFANILKYLRITLTSSFGNFYSVAVASLFLPFVPLLPVQILLLNLLSDFPMIAVATDRVDHEELEKPKSYHVGSVIFMATLFGLVSSLFDLMLFSLFAEAGSSVLQTAWFLLSVVTEVILIFSLRSRLPFFRSGWPAGLLTLLSILAIGVVFALPYTFIGQHFFHFVRPTGALLLIILGFSVTYFVITEIVKHFYTRHFDGLHRQESAF